MKTILLLITLLILTTIPASASGGALLIGHGYLLQSYTLSDGASIVISYHGLDRCIQFAYATADGAITSECYPIPNDLGIPYTYQVHLCGRYVQLIGTWPGEEMNGPLYVFSFRLPKNSGLCDLERTR